MNDGRLGFGGSLWAALRRPRELFAAWQAGRAELHPLLLYGLGIVASVTGIVLDVGTAVFGSTTRAAVFGIVFGLLLAPISWLFDMLVSHGALRLLGARGHWKDTQAALGGSSVPRMLCLVPLLAPLFEIWSVVIRVIGFRELHGVRLWRGLVAAILPIVVSVPFGFALRAVWLEAFKMPSLSMFPTLLQQDHLFVRKWSYGWSGKSAPRRGDVVVFSFPDPNHAQAPQSFVKRVIALPGDTLELRGGASFINGWQVPRCRIGGMGAVSFTDRAAVADVFVEFLDGNAYLTVYSPGNPTQGPWRVPESECFVLGDNRDNSSDSRTWNDGRGGGVPFGDLKGRAGWLWLPMDRLGIDLSGKPTLPTSLKRMEPELARCLAQAPSRDKTVPPPPSARPKP